MTQDDIDVCETLFDILEKLEDEEDRRKRRKRRDDRERERRGRRDDEDYRMHSEKASKRKEVFDGENLISIDDRGRKVDDDDNEWHREKERKRAKEREWDRGKERCDREERGQREERRRAREGSHEKRRRRSRTWSSSDSDQERKKNKAEDDEDERVQMMKEEGYDQPPCVRLINQETLQLYIVTISGGLVGLTPECDVKVPDQTLPPRLAQLTFVQDKKADADKKEGNDDGVEEFARRFSRYRNRRSSRSRSRSRNSAEKEEERSGSCSPGSSSSSSNRRNCWSELRPGEKAEWRRIEKHVKKRQLPPNASRKERRAFERIWGKIDGEPIHGNYFLRVLSNAAKCTIDGVKIKKGESDVAVTHGATIAFAKTNRFTLHIHSGRNTCAGCEPGLLLAAAAAAAPQQPQKKPLKGEAARRAQLRQMKESLGLDAEENKAERNHYQDRAKERRKKFGSEPIIPLPRSDCRLAVGSAAGIYYACAARPVPGAVPIVTPTDAKVAANKAISSENKGFKLLKAMGWKEGDGLGKKQEGITEPVSTEFKGDRAGLGAAAAAATAAAATKKCALWESARNRFKEIEEAEKRKTE